MFIGNIEHVKLPSKGQISIWTDNALKFIDPRELHQIHGSGSHYGSGVKHRGNYQTAADPGI